MSGARPVGQRVEERDGVTFVVTEYAPKRRRVKRSASIKGGTGVAKRDQILLNDGTPNPAFKRRRKTKRQQAQAAWREEQRHAYVPKDGPLRRKV